jgi:hypothetical protein
VGWYDDGFRKRAAITIDTTLAGTVDVNVSIPYWWEDFWGDIDATGLELRVTAADGVTLLAYSVDNGAGLTFDRSIRAGRIRIDGFVGVNGGVSMAWVYWSTDGTEGTAAVATTIAAPVSGWIELGTPALHVAEHAPQRPGVTIPRQVIQKGSTENIHVWIRVDRALEKRTTPNASSRLYEEVRGCVHSIVDNAGSDASTTYDLDEVRFVYRNGETWVRVNAKAGSSGSNYTIAPTIATKNPHEVNESSRVLQPRIGLAVRNVLAP